MSEIEITCDRCQLKTAYFWTIRDPQGKERHLCGLCFKSWARDYYPPIRRKREIDRLG